MGIKKFLFGEDSTSEKADKILKDKKIGWLDKFVKIRKLYLNYFSYDLYKDAKTSLYENHYEKIMIYGTLQASTYRRLYDEEIKNVAFYNAFVLCRQFDELVKQGFNAKYLTSSQGDFAKDVINLKNECGFNKYFNGDEFYSNKIFRDKVSTKVNQFVEKCQQQYQSEREYDM